MNEDPLTGGIIGCAIEVHRELVLDCWRIPISNVWSMNFV